MIYSNNSGIHKLLFSEVRMMYSKYFDRYSMENIESVGAEFAEYLRQVQPAFERAVANQSKYIMDITLYLERYMYFLSFVADNKLYDDLHESVMELVSKFATDVLGIHNCLVSGYPVQAATILRSLVETTITIKFIALDFDKRIGLFHDYRDFVYYHKMKSHPSIVSENDRRYLESRYEELRNKFSINADWYHILLKDLIRTDVALDGSRPNFRTLSKIAGMENDYLDTYHSLSFPVHGSSVTGHLFQSKDGRYSSGPIFNREITKSLVLMTLRYGHICIETLLSTTQETLVWEPMIDYSNMLLITSVESINPQMIRDYE